MFEMANYELYCFDMMKRWYHVPYQRRVHRIGIGSIGPRFFKTADAPLYVWPLIRLFLSLLPPLIHKNYIYLWWKYLYTPLFLTQPHFDIWFKCVTVRACLSDVIYNLHAFIFFMSNHKNTNPLVQSVQTFRFFKAKISTFITISNSHIYSLIHKHFKNSIIIFF